MAANAIGGNGPSDLTDGRSTTYPSAPTNGPGPLYVQLVAALADLKAEVRGIHQSEGQQRQSLDRQVPYSNYTLISWVDPYIIVGFFWFGMI